MARIKKDKRLYSHQPITHDDLRRLGWLAEEDRRRFFRARRDWGRLYRDRVLCIALCQGAALHYVRGSGINDFDVYTFYAANPKRRWYAKRLRAVDFGDPKFGRSQVTRPGFVGRRVDLQGREIPVPAGTDPVVALREYLRAAKTRTARELAAKAVILLKPDHLLGTVVWP